MRYIMPTTSVNITEQQNSWIINKVASGDYNNASEVFREGLRALKARDERENLELQLLRQKVGFGVNQANNGEFSTRDINQIIADSKGKLSDG